MEFYEHELKPRPWLDLHGTIRYPTLAANYNRTLVARLYRWCRRCGRKAVCTPKQFTHKTAPFCTRCAQILLDEKINLGDLL